MTYPLFLYAVRCPLYAVFRPNAQVRPFIERRSFSAPSDIIWDLGVLFWTFKFEKFEFGLSRVFEGLGFRAFVVRPFFDN